MRSRYASLSRATRPRSIRGRVAVVCGLAVATLAPRRAHAVDLPKVAGTPAKLEVTETSIVAQRFAARQGESPNDQGYFAWINRLNAVLSWRKLTFGLRLDSSVYELRPEDRSFPTAGEKRSAIADGATRFRDAVYPAKVWLTYKSTGVEVTAGDNYVQFGRGLVLSLRRIDELGIDTTLFGGKVVFAKDPFSVTLIAGQANPARIDEPTGRALFLPKPVSFDPRARQPIFGADRIVGAQLQAGRGLPVSASTQVVQVSKCAPYAYNPDGTVKDGFLQTPFGTCAEEDRAVWLDTLPKNLGPVLNASKIVNASQTLEVPSLWGHGNVYVEAAVQRRELEDRRSPDTNGNAIYGSFVLTAMPVSNTLEVKSYRNFYPTSGSVNVSRASAFGNVSYSAPPTAEVVIQDSMFGFFNVCVTGARDRFDYRFTPTFLAYGTFGYFVTKSEVPGGQCDELGRSTAGQKDRTTDHVADASAGIEARFDNDRSYWFANITARDDVRGTGDAYYRELSAQYSFTKYLGGKYSFELSGRHRYRIQDEENLRGTNPRGEPWWQGEHYNTLKISPKWVVSQGFEYTTFIGQPSTYVNGGVLYRFTSESNIRLYAGQNRGGLRCISGICRNFPAFSGARAELTFRF